MTSNIGRHAVEAVVIVAVVALVVCVATPAYAEPAPPPNPTDQLSAVLGRATGWLVGILATVATLFLTVGGVRYVMAGGDPGEVEKAKGAFKSAAMGYGLAALAPIVVGILKFILGVS